MEKVTWADWWASRTIKFNTLMASCVTAAVAVLTQIDEATLTAFGMTPKNVLIAMAVIKIADNLANNGLRGITTKPLAGRAG
jgi:hypothetical protein